MRIRRSFTLIELLVVVGIIALLASVVTVAVGKARSSSKEKRVITDLSTIATAVESYKAINGKYPDSFSGTVPAEISGYLQDMPNGANYKDGFAYYYQNLNIGGGNVSRVVLSTPQQADYIYCIKDSRVPPQKCDNTGLVNNSIDTNIYKRSGL